MGNQATKDKKNVILHQVKPNTVSKTFIDVKCNVINEMQYSYILLVCLAMGEQGKSMPIFHASEELPEWFVSSGYITSQSS